MKSVKVIKLSTDIGELSFTAITAFLKHEFTQEDLKKLTELLRNDCFIIILDAFKIMSLHQVLYSIYLALRNRMYNIYFAKDVVIEALTLTACTRQIIEALNEISPVGKNVIIIAMVCREVNEKLSKVFKKILNEIKPVEYVVGVGCLRGIKSPSKCGEVYENDEIFMKIVNAILEKY